jgi:UDP-N-acetylmuramoylalanine--D-glutamate ligase
LGASVTDWSATSFCVAGIGVAGYAAADALMQMGAQVSIVDSGDGEEQREHAGASHRGKWGA